MSRTNFQCTRSSIFLLFLSLQVVIHFKYSEVSSIILYNIKFLTYSSEGNIMIIIMIEPTEHYIGYMST